MDERGDRLRGEKTTYTEEEWIRVRGGSAAESRAELELALQKGFATRLPDGRIDCARFIMAIAEDQVAREQGRGGSELFYMSYNEFGGEEGGRPLGRW